ncbi:MAG: DUF4349 domain-containing protein [Mariniblastus sp.]
MSHADIRRYRDNRLPQSTPPTSMFRIRFFAGCFLILVTFVGCGDAYNSKDYITYDSTVANESNAMIGGRNAGLAGEKSPPLATPSRPTTPDKDQSPSKARTAELNRKIIYNTKIGLVVKDYPTFESTLPQLVNSHGGFIASNNTDRRYNNSQSGTWIVRVPVSEYSDFLTGITSLGFAESRNEKAQDVTEEFVDVEARVKNKKQLEQRILKMLEDRSGKLTDVLEIERELSRVREEIERMEGRIRFLIDRTSLATVTISCREEKEYIPTAAPTLASRISESWSDSTGSLQTFGTNLLLFIIGAAPWLFALGVITTFSYFVLRRLLATTGWFTRANSEAR